MRATARRSARCAPQRLHNSGPPRARAGGVTTLHARADPGSAGRGGASAEAPYPPRRVGVVTAALCVRDAPRLMPPKCAPPGCPLPDAAPPRGPRVGRGASAAPRPLHAPRRLCLGRRRPADTAPRASARAVSAPQVLAPPGPVRPARRATYKSAAPHEPWGQGGPRAQCAFAFAAWRGWRALVAGGPPGTLWSALPRAFQPRPPPGKSNLGVCSGRLPKDRRAASAALAGRSCSAKCLGGEVWGSCPQAALHEMRKRWGTRLFRCPPTAGGGGGLRPPLAGRPPPARSLHNSTSRVSSHGDTRAPDTSQRGDTGITNLSSARARARRQTARRRRRRGGTSGEAPQKVAGSDTKTRIEKRTNEIARPRLRARARAAAASRAAGGPCGRRGAPCVRRCARRQGGARRTSVPSMCIECVGRRVASPQAHAASRAASPGSGGRCGVASLREAAPAHGQPSGPAAMPQNRAKR